MEQKKTKKWLKGLLATLLCVPLSLGVLVGCGGETGGTGGETGDEQGDEQGDETKDPIAQSTVQDASALTYTGIDEVTITDPYAVNALDKELAYLVDTIDADKLLYYFYVNAKIPDEAQASEGYGGNWEGKLIGGHTMGHYLTALAQAYANAGTSAARKAEVLQKIEYIVGELKKCQDHAVEAGAEEGFIWGAPMVSGSTDPEKQFDNVERNLANIETQAWVPWYTMHKILAGLIDLYDIAGSEVALGVAVKLGDWVCNRVGKWSAATQKTVLGIEYGGMNDALYNLYAVTGEQKYAVAAHKFDEETLFSKITGNAPNYLSGLHANTTIPKIIGALNGYIKLKNASVEGVNTSGYLEVAEDFWDYVIKHHSYVTGGNSENEHFGSEDTQNARRDNINCETCNTYNMLKLSRMLFTLTQERKYLDYYENTYYNAIWSSQNPETGMTMYFQPMASGYFKVYSTPEDNFWCCTGSGMESMSKLNDSIYYTAKNATYVAMYLSSIYKTEGLELVQTADLENSDTAKIEIKEGQTTLRLRRPYWTGEFSVSVNGAPVELKKSDKFVSVDVKAGDTVTVNVKKNVRAYNLTDASDCYAFFYGPFLLSAEMGTEDMQTTGHGAFSSVTKPARAYGDDLYSVNAANVTEFIKNLSTYLIKGENNKFTLTCNNGTLTYSYHFRQYQQRYGIYMYFTTETIEKNTPDFTWEENLGGGSSIRAGYGQDENNLQTSSEDGTESASNVETYGTYRRALAGGWFSYDMPVTADAENRLLVNFAKADNGKTIKISVDGTEVYAESLNYTGAESMYSVGIPLSETLVKNAKNGYVTVRFESNNAQDAAMICGTIFMQHLENNMAYFVDCGDYSVNTTDASDHFGIYNSVTEQVYGADPKTGKKWGIVDENSANIAGTCTKGIGTNTTWAYEANQGDVSKTDSNRYTKNQYENGWQTMKLAYKFELPDGKYKVKVYFTDPWGCSQEPTVSANGTVLKSNCVMNKEISMDATVTGGELLLEFTNQRNDSTRKCINLCYIIISFVK